MAEEQANGGATPPAATTKLITLPFSKRTVTIRRWSFQRSLAVTRFMHDMTTGMPDDLSMDLKSLMHYWFEKGGLEFLHVAKLSLVEADADVVNDEMDATDAFFLIEEVFKFNDAKENLKNGLSLAGQFAVTKIQAKADKKKNPN